MTTPKIQQLDLASRIQKIDRESWDELGNSIERISLLVALADQTISSAANVPDDYVRGLLMRTLEECIGDINTVEKIIESHFKQSLWETNNGFSEFSEVIVKEKNSEK